MKATGCVGSIPTRGNEIFIKIYIFISSLWCRGKARGWVLTLQTQCLQNSVESGEPSVLTLCSLCSKYFKNNISDNTCIKSNFLKNENLAYLHIIYLLRMFSSNSIYLLQCYILYICIYYFFWLWRHLTYF